MDKVTIRAGWTIGAVCTYTFFLFFFFSIRFACFPFYSAGGDRWTRSKAERTEWKHCLKLFAQIVVRHSSETVRPFVFCFRVLDSFRLLLYVVLILSRKLIGWSDECQEKRCV